MEDRDWLIIQKLYTERSITKAAQALYISQPALTSRLQHIEHEFNVQIVHRTSKGIQFTPQGEYLVKQAAVMIDKMRDIKNEVQESFSENAGTLDIGTSNYLAMNILPGLLAKFKKKYPAVTYRVVTDWSKNVFTLIFNQKIQLGIVNADYGGWNNKCLIYEEPVYIVYKDAFKLADLPKLPKIEYEMDYILKTQADKWWRENFKQPPQVSMNVSTMESCNQMVIRGLGYAILPAYLLKNFKGDVNKIIMTDAEGNQITIKTWLLYNDLSKDIPLVKLFVDFAKKYKF